MITAQVIIRYPIVGKIIFRQPRDEPEMDTTIIVEHLVHADGTALNDSVDHRYPIFLLLIIKNFHFVSILILSFLILKLLTHNQF